MKKMKTQISIALIALSLIFTMIGCKSNQAKMIEAKDAEILALKLEYETNATIYLKRDAAYSNAISKTTDFLISSGHKLTANDHEKYQQIMEELLVKLRQNPLPNPK